MVIDSAQVIAATFCFEASLNLGCYIQQHAVAVAMNGSRGKAAEFSASEKEPMTDGTDGERANGTTGNKTSIVKLYIMKMARPRGGEENGTLKKLHGEFTAIQTEIKGIQTRLNEKRVSLDLPDLAARFFLLSINLSVARLDSLCRKS